MREEVLVIIPARGGSVGVPRKNVRALGGRPLVAWSIEQALRSPSVTRVIVSTDDREIAAVSRAHGAEVMKRPAELSDCAASSESALVHCLATLRDAEGYSPQLVVFLQATSPFRRPGDIEGAIWTLREEEADSLFSCTPSHGFLWRREEDGPRSLNYDHRVRPRRQDAAEDVVENGSIYLFRPWVLELHANRLGGRIATYPMRPIDSFQIDEPEDFLLMEAILAKRDADPPTPSRLASIRLLLLDFDGVLTDNRVYVDQTGLESVACHRGDGWGIARLREAGVEVQVISTETNPVVAARCAKLGIRCRQGISDKRAVVRSILAAGHVREEVAFVGNDVNDLGALELVGLPIVVADATPGARAAAHWVTQTIGGAGAVREVADAILSARAAEMEVRRVA